MNTLKNYVDFRLTHADKFAEAEEYPLKLSDCKKYKPMRELKIYGNSIQDDTPTPDEPIEVQSVGELVTDENDVNYGKYKIPAICRGINLFNSDLWLKYFDKLEDGSYHSNRNILTTLTIPFYLRAGTYTISLDIKCPVDSRYRPYMKDADGNVVYINHTYTGTSDWERLSFTFTSTKDAVLMCWTYNTITNDLSFRNFQIEEGMSSTPYEPYVEPLTTNIFLDEPLRKLGDYTDYIDFKNNKVVRVIKEQIMTGAESMIYMGGSYPYIAYNVGAVGYIVDDICLCNQLQHQSNFSTSREGINTFRVLNSPTNNASRIVFRIFAEGVAVVDVSKVKALLAEKYANNTPLIFYYGLNESTEEPINLDLPKLTAKTSIIEVDTSLAPSNAYGKYIKK